MADNTDVGPPPLEDPNSPEYVSLECQIMKTPCVLNARKWLSLEQTPPEMATV